MDIFKALELSHDNKDKAIEEIKKLVKTVDVNKPDENGVHPIIYAVATKQIEIVKLLVDAGADLDVESKAILSHIPNHTPLHCATDGEYKADTTDILELLLNKGANPNVVDKYNESPLFSAVKNTDAEKVGVLLNADKYDANEEPGNVILHAIYTELMEDKGYEYPLEEKMELVQILLDFGFDESKHVTNGYCYTSLSFALELGLEKMINLLLPKVNAAILKSKEGFTGRTPLHFAAMQDCNKNKEILQLLIEAHEKFGVSVNIQDNEGNTALHYASKNVTRKLTQCRQLIEAGANANLKNNKGESPADKKLIFNIAKANKKKLAKNKKNDRTAASTSEVDSANVHDLTKLTKTTMPEDSKKIPTTSNKETNRGTSSDEPKKTKQPQILRFTSI